MNSTSLNTNAKSAIFFPDNQGASSPDVLTRYIKVRELAEIKAKEKIDKLNQMIDKWEKRDQKAKELLMDTLIERKLRAQ
jgi:hypothetical protein